MSRLLLILILTPVLSFAQYRPQDGLLYSTEYSAPSETIFNVGKLETINQSTVSDFIRNYRAFNLENSSLLLLDSTRSPVSVHYNYSQQHNGIEVYGAGCKVNIGLDGRIRSVTNNLIHIPEVLSKEFPDTEKFLKKYEGVKNNFCYFHYDGKMVPSLRIEMPGPDFAKYEVIVNRKGKVLYVQDLVRHLGTDSIVSAKVFLPDPLTTAGKIYGGAYADNADGDNSELNNERFDVTMTVDFTNDTFRLSSSRVEIQNFANPSTTVAFSETPVFNYTRSEFEFEDVNCFYHLSVFQEYMQSLGFSLVNYQIGVDAHAFFIDNSQFSYPLLYFGDGCVDDGEDADVIIHEYGHAITASAAPNTWTGSERKALDEGAGDYLATSYTRALNPFNWELMFGWDGNNACWPGRTAATTKHYPEDLTGDIHQDGEIWNAALMQIWEVLGRETTDEIYLQSIYSYAKNISMTDAAYMFLDADSLKNWGANYITCYYWLERRGFIPPLPFFSGTDGNGDKASCYNVCDASLVVIPISGTAPYTFAWKDSLGTPLAGATDTITGVCAGKYTVLVTDSAGDTVTVNVEARQPSVLTAAITVEDEACSFCSDGSTFIQPNGGTPPYIFQWNDAAAQTSKAAIGLDSGYYQVLVTDANGCTYLDSGLVGVDNSGELGMIFLSSLNLNCNGNCSGKIEAAAYGGITPYVYKWSDPLNQSTSEATGLCAGLFFVTISDANGDSLVDSLAVTVPLAMSSIVTTTPDSGNGEGTASISVTNGVPPLVYTWNDTQIQTTVVATGLTSGSYTVSWVDANACVGSDTVTVSLFTSAIENSVMEVSIYPNPSTGIVFVRSTSVKGPLVIQLRNLLGQLVFAEILDSNGQINLNSFRNGLYHIEVIYGETVLLRDKLILH